MVKGRRYLFILTMLLIAGLSACQSIESSPTSMPTILEPTRTSTVVQSADETPIVTETLTEQPTQMPTATNELLQDVNQFPDTSRYQWVSFVDGLVNPLDMVQIPDDSNRFYVLEQTGLVRLVDNQQVVSQPVLDLSRKVTTQGNEQGLLGIALAPDFLNNRNFYLNYTNRQGNTVIARYVMDETLTTADQESEQVILTQEQPYSNHNGGGLAFGPDQFLYIGLGDGGSAGDPQQRAQNSNTLLGKLLRIAVLDQESYAIPSNNPYVDQEGRAEIWALGLRNPWRFSFDTLTGDLYIADVGQGDWEEIDYLPADHTGIANFGWDYKEGTHSFEGDIPSNLDLIDPIFEYDHSQGCSVTGGYVYRGKQLPDFYGVYFFGDFCSGTVWGLIKDGSQTWQSKALFETNQNITSFAQDLEGEIYLISRSGAIFKLQK